jgi:hypothetical protein
VTFASDRDPYGVGVEAMRREVKAYRRQRRRLWWLHLIRRSIVVPPKPRI